MPNVTSLEPLSKLEELQSLSLATLPGWDASGKVSVIDSLEPVAKLSKLEFIELLGVRPQSKSLTELEKCPALKSGRFSKYPKKEIERFKAKMEITDGFIPKPEFSQP